MLSSSSGHLTLGNQRDAAADADAASFQATAPLLSPNETSLVYSGSGSEILKSFRSMKAGPLRGAYLALGDEPAWYDHGYCAAHKTAGKMLYGVRNVILTHDPSSAARTRWWILGQPRLSGSCNGVRGGVKLVINSSLRYRVALVHLFHSLLLVGFRAFDDVVVVLGGAKEARAPYRQARERRPPSWPLAALPVCSALRRDASCCYDARSLSLSFSPATDSVHLIPSLSFTQS